MTGGKGKLAALIIGEMKKKKSSDGGDDEESGDESEDEDYSSMGGETAMQECMTALKGDDAGEALSAFKNLLDVCGVDHK